MIIPLKVSTKRLYANGERRRITRALQSDALARFTVMAVRGTLPSATA